MEAVSEDLSGPEVKTNTQHECKSCGNAFEGLYCNLCGEKRLEPSDRSVKSFLANVLTLADNKFLRTLLLVVGKPGLLSREYAEGRRVKYLRPLQLFFVLNLIYFLSPGLQLFNTSLRTQMYLRSHSALVREMVFSEVGNDRLALEGYSLMYNQKSNSLAKLLVIAFVFAASVPMMLIYRKRNRYFTDHVVLAVELTSFNLLINAIALSFLLMVINNVLHWTHSGWEKYLDDLTLTVIFVLTNSYFLFRAGRTFYAQRGMMLIVKVVIGLIGLFLALELYRMLLFFVTFGSL